MCIANGSGNTTWGFFCEPAQRSGCCLAVVGVFLLVDEMKASKAAVTAAQQTKSGARTVKG